MRPAPTTVATHTFTLNALMRAPAGHAAPYRHGHGHGNDYDYDVQVQRISYGTRTSRPPTGAAWVTAMALPLRRTTSAYWRAWPPAFVFDVGAVERSRAARPDERQRPPHGFARYAHRHLDTVAGPLGPGLRAHTLDGDAGVDCRRPPGPTPTAKAPGTGPCARPSAD